MPVKQENASTLIESDAEDGKIHLKKCDVTATDGKPCPIWTPV